MYQRVVIKIGSGSIETGYAAAVQISDEGMAPRVETQAYLPPAPDLPGLYRQWQESYWQLGHSYRLEAHGGVTNVSAIADTEACLTLSCQLRDRIRHWLNGDDFRPIREKLLEQLSPQDTVRFLLQTQDPLLQRLPWYELQFYDRYRQAEVGICSPNYQQASYQGTRSAKVRVLAVIGDAAGLNTQIDRALLNQLPDAEIHFLREPNRETFTRCLWERQGWDILFFAGHSNSRTNCNSDSEGSGEMLLNATDKLTIPQLKHALKKAIERGLNTAIFNSCDGLGLAADLADLHIPQVLVMREPVPDLVAHAFLQGFLESFSAGNPFYIAVREAREKLQGLETRFPCATWLPVIVQNLAETPPTWDSLQGRTPMQTRPIPPGNRAAVTQKRPWEVGLSTGIVMATAVLLFRQLGWLQPYELKAYDHLLRLRPPENPDGRLLIITNTAEDIAQLPDPTGKSSLSEETLSLLLAKLTPLNPQTIGLDIYRSQPAADSTLAQQIETTQNLIAICKGSDKTTATKAIAPPPEIKDAERIGASDFLDDSQVDQVLRRHLMYFEPVPADACQAGETFSTVIALRYLEAAHNISLVVDQYLGAARLPITQKKQTSFGGYRNLDTGGIQTLLNYRLLRNPEAMGCGDVKETPADCMTVSEVLAADAAQLRSSIKGKIVLIGTTDMDFAYLDRWPTPYTRKGLIEDRSPGVFLHAQMISQIISAALEGRLLLSSWTEWQEMVWIASWVVLGGLIGAYSYSRWQYRLWLRLLMAEGILLLACWLWLTEAGIWVPWVPGAIALPAAALTSHAILQSPLQKPSSRRRLAE